MTFILLSGQAILWQETFDTNNGWTLNNNWTISGGLMRFYYNPTVTNYSLSATSPSILVPTNATELIINQYFQDFSTDTGEVMQIIIQTANASDQVWYWDTTTNDSWGINTGTDLVIPISQYAGQTVNIQFLSTGGSTYNIDNWDIFNIQFIHSVANDLSATSITGPTTVMSGNISEYTVSIQNLGINPQADYTVQLMQTGNDTPLATVPGNNIITNETQNYFLSWTPVVPGEYQLYGKVVCNGDGESENNTTPSINVTVEYNPISTVNVGIDQIYLNTNYPANFYYKASISQTIYLQNEINKTGNITNLKYYMNLYGDIPVNRPIKIWMATTTNQNFASNTSWIPFNQFTLVYDGVVNLNTAGNYTIDLPLLNPYPYNGGNLVIMVLRPLDSSYYSSANKFYTSWVNSARTLSRHSDTINFNPETPGTGATYTYVGNITLTIQNLPGSVSGLVQSNTNPISNALVQIESPVLSATTNQNGEFSFQNLIAPFINITASAFGYYPQSINTVPIIPGQNSTVNFNLSPRGLMTVYGSIVANDTGNPINNATISLTGYDNYQQTSNAQGEFVFPAVFENNSYTLQIQRPGFQSYTAQIEVLNTNLVIPQIIMYENTNEPLNVLATITTNNFVNIIWTKPNNLIPMTGNRAHDSSLQSEEPITGRYDIRSIGGYKIYRTLLSNQDNPDLWSYIGTTYTANDTTFSDFYWYQAPTGSYKYVIKAVYTGDIISIPAFSNTLNTVFIPTHFIKVWVGNGISHMNIIVSSASVNDTALGEADEIAVFDSVYCVGFKRLTGPISNYISFVVSMDDPATPQIDGYQPGNPIKFKIWKNSQTTEYSGLEVNPYYISGTNIFSIGATSSVRLLAYPYSTQSIPFTSGWNIISSYVSPLNKDLSSVFLPLISGNSLVKVQNEQGFAFEYLPYINAWINNIGNLSNTEGYYVKVNNNTQLSVSGYRFGLPHTIGLTEGWNLINYPFSQSKPAMTILQNLINNNQLVKVSDQSGNAIENIPGIGWINNIQNFAPGKGYAVKVNTNTNLIYDFSSRNQSITTIPPISQTNNLTRHYTTNWTGNGWQHFNLYILNSEILRANLTENDEIAVFDGDQCVVTALYQESNPYIILSSSLDDNTTTQVDGFVSGHSFSLKIWSSSQNIELTQVAYQSLNNQLLFEPLGSTYLQIDQLSETTDISPIMNTEIKSIYPNPFNPSTTIAYSVCKNENITVRIYNVKGQMVKELINKTHTPGNYQLKWNGIDDKNRSVSSGIYFVRFDSQSKNIIKKIIMVK